MYFVGIDIAKHHHEAAILDESGKVILKKLKFDNSHQGYDKLMNQVRKLNSEVVFAMEATGHYWLPLYAHLRSDNQTVHVINPIQLDALRGLYIRRTKNDAIDAQIIADVVRFGRYCKTSVAPIDLLSLRELCRQRFYIVDTASDFKRKVIALMDQLFPEYQKIFSDTFGKSSLELLSYYTTPEQMLEVDSNTQLTTITGIGITLAATIFSEIGGNIQRFSESGKLAAFAGIDPTVKQSGEFNGTKNKMSKRGSPYLRRAIWLASTVAAFKDPAINQFYEKKKAEGKEYLTIIGHICRKMVSIIFAVLRDNKPYVPILKSA